MLWHPLENEELESLVNDILRTDTTIYQCRQTLFGIFVKYGQYSKCLTIRCSVNHVVIAPYMVFAFWSAPNTLTVIQPQSYTLWLSLRHLGPFLSPDPFHAFMIHLPVFILKRCCYPLVSIPTITSGHLNNASSKLFLTSGDMWHMSLCYPCLV